MSSWLQRSGCIWCNLVCNIIVNAITSCFKITLAIFHLSYIYLPSFVHPSSLYPPLLSLYLPSVLCLLFIFNLSSAYLLSSVCRSFYLPIRRSVYLFVCLSVSLSVHYFICLPIKHAVGNRRSKSFNFYPVELTQFFDAFYTH